MEQYVCSVCGYVYDEAKGIPQAGIAPGTRWEDLPSDWTCPVCGAGKQAFVKKGTEAAKTTSNAQHPVEALKEMDALELSAVCSNLARGCEKQYRQTEAEQYRTLAAYFKTGAKPEPDASAETLANLVGGNLEQEFVRAREAASADADRGALRALTWSEKVTRMLESLLARYAKEGAAMLEHTNVYVCTICGFVFIGDKAPELCPVCKVPSWKFELVEGRA